MIPPPHRAEPVQSLEQHQLVLVAERVVYADLGLDVLDGLAPAAIEQPVRRGDLGGVRRFRILHHAVEDADGAIRALPRQIADIHDFLRRAALELGDAGLNLCISDTDSDEAAIRRPQ